MAGPIAYYQIRWRPTDSDGEWTQVTQSPETSSVSIKGIDRTKTYVIQARSVGPTGLKSVWVDISHTVAGNATPVVPTSVAAQAAADSVVLTWAFPYTLPADVLTCIERSSTGSGGPFGEIVQTKSNRFIVTEKVDGTYHYRLRTKTYTNVYSAYSAIVSGNPDTIAELNADIAAALLTAQNAQAAADGVIDTYWQTTPPTIGGSSGAKVGDIWYDTDDGNKIYRVVGSSWILSRDDGIAQAILSASGAQATADGKVKTYYFPSTAPPTATAVGDLWFQTDYNVLMRWNGSFWQIASDNSLENQAVSSLVKNGGFEAGTYGWTLSNVYLEASTNAAYAGARGIVRGPGMGGPDGVLESQSFPVNGGDTFIVEMMVKALGSPNGNAFAMMWYYDVNDAFVASANENGLNGYLSENSVVGANGWRKIVGSRLVPSNIGIVKARVGFFATAHTAGYYCVDQIRCIKYERTVSVGKNLLTNTSFGGINGSKSPEWAIGWNPVGAAVTLAGPRETWVASGYKMPAGTRMECRQNGIGGGTPAVVDIRNTVFMSVTPGGRYEASVRIGCHRCSAYIVIGWYDTAGAQIGEDNNAYMTYTNFGTPNSPPSKGGKMGFFCRAPSGAASAIFLVRKNNTDAGQADSYVFVEEPFFGEASEPQAVLSEFSAGPITYADQLSPNDTAPIAYQDLYDGSWNSWAKRLALSVAGSGKKIGDQRNLTQSLVTSYGAVRNTTALSVTSGGAVTVNAFSVRYGGVSVSYNGVTNAVTGLTQLNRYVIYAYDPDYTGGTKTWFAGANPDAVMQLGDGVVIAGEVFVPNSGTGTGGGGSSGGGGGGWCVDADMLLPDGRRARDIVAGDVIPCWNDDPIDPEVVYIEVESNELVEDQPCRTIITSGKAVVTASDSTPMTLRSGKIVGFPDMLGEDALVRDVDGVLSWQEVVGMSGAEYRTVAKIKVHQRCYFVGHSAELTIATHNPTAKP